MEDINDINALFGLTRGSDGISPIERLLNEFEAHESKEERALELYRKAHGQMPNTATSFLMQMIISDEEKHRAVVHAMAATLRGSLTWTRPANSLEGAGDLMPTNEKLLEATEDFIRLEKEGIREYKTLVKDTHNYYHGLFKILIDSMIRDSEKHVELLEFLKDRLRQA